ncbi:tryptophan halogenase family protein [Cellvibrio mixtus]|uniref:tryptophan halogenase family protein n=1 Tax=Cellvibrio mixtus TaxID=39650 RepID=UPI000587CFB1|nr:tryptophan halogenase family protein [Cellvibrio mixtus]
MNSDAHISQRINTIIIVGGGTAGWMTAATLAKVLGNDKYSIQLIESDAIGTIGVGEATIPHIGVFNKILGIDEQDFMRSTQATFKLGIEFINWGNVGESYIHPFGSYGVNIDSLHFYNYFLKMSKQGGNYNPEDYSVGALAARNNKFMHPLNITRSPLGNIKYAYHFDAGLYAKYLRNYAENKGVGRIEGKITRVKLQEDNGFIDSVLLEDGRVYSGDLFIDCSGFRGILIEEALGTGYEDWSNLLPCDSAIAVPTANIHPPKPYTRSVAQKAGWQWHIPLQHRTGNGHVYSSRFMCDEQARQILLNNVEGGLLAEPRVVRFKTGMRRKFWNKNCVAVGLSSGFIEPLESTSIHLIQTSIKKLLEFFPGKYFNQGNIDAYNEILQRNLLFIRDFIVLHYKATHRQDSAFWNYCRTMPIPDSLEKRIDLYRQEGKIYHDSNELFSEDSWFAVMQGQGLESNNHHPLVDVLSEQQLRNFFSEIKSVVANSVNAMPTHADYIANYCAQ